MKYYSGMSKDEFLDYVTSHSDTPRALFRKDMVAEMLYLSGQTEDAETIIKQGKEWYSIDMRDLVYEVRNPTLKKATI